MFSSKFDSDKWRYHGQVSDLFAAKNKPRMAKVGADRKAQHIPGGVRSGKN